MDERDLRRETRAMATVTTPKYLMQNFRDRSDVALLYEWRGYDLEATSGPQGWTLVGRITEPEAARYGFGAAEIRRIFTRPSEPTHA
jgi:hypothetical protein